MIWNSVNNKSIHIIVSNDVVRNRLVKLLSKISPKIKTFENTNDFINEPISEAPACLITEIKLDGSDSIALIKQMREHGFSTPVVVIADGSQSIQTAIEAIQAGATDFIEQPIVERDFLERMQSILNRK